jgi:hypothetical protein
MFDPCFKNMDCIMDHIGVKQIILLVQQYDDFFLLPSLNNNVGYINPNQATTPLAPTPPQPPSNGLCGLVASSQEGFEGFIKIKLFVFHKFHVENANGLDPLKWWGCNQFKFPNVGFLAQHILRILGSQIKTK